MWAYLQFHLEVVLHTAVSRKLSEKKRMRTTILKGNLGYDQYTVPDTVAVEPTFVAFFSLASIHPHVHAFLFRLKC